MNHMTKSVVEPLGAAVHGPPGPISGESDSRTLLKRCLLDTVLPAIALLSMSALTITMIVVVVTTVAHAGWLTPPTYVSVDPWSGLYADSDVQQDNGYRRTASDVSVNVARESQTNAGYVAAQMPE